jgi:inner membrane protein
MALGAAVGGAALGRSQGARAFAWGAVVGTLPDLDSFIDFGSPVANFTFHRGYSHALLIQTLAAPLLAAVINALHRGGRRGYPGWLLAVWLILITHALLDALTIYGTQLALPFTDYPFGVGSIFIIDPLYTLPLLIGVVAALALGRRAPVRARRWNRAGLVLSTAYLCWGLAAQQLVLERAREALADADLKYDRLLVTPTPFNSLLWRIVAVGDTAYLEGFHRIGAEAPPEFHRYPRHPRLLEDIREAWPVQRLAYFTKGFYGVEPVDGRVVMTDLRMGIEPYYSFSYAVGRIGPDGVEALRPEQPVDIPRPPLGAVFDDLLACAAGEPTRFIQC